MKHTYVDIIEKCRKAYDFVDNQFLRIDEKGMYK